MLTCMHARVYLKNCKGMEQRLLEVQQKTCRKCSLEANLHPAVKCSHARERVLAGQVKTFAGQKKSCRAEKLCRAIMKFSRTE